MMEIVKGIENYIHSFPTAVTVGKFDGIHQGHEALVDLITQRSGLRSVMVTFEKSPKQVLFFPEMKFIVTEEERNAILEKQGVDVLLVLPFDEKLMKLSPEDFIRLLIEKVNMRYLAVGSDFTFGYKGAGDKETLRTLSSTLGFRLDVIEKIKDEGEDISSTRIRALIEKGAVDEAARLLGRPYFIYGQVVHGKHIGSGMGIPTINLLPPEKKLLPPFGVYVTTVDIGSRIYHGVTNVGTNPTVSEDAPVTVETNLLDVNTNLYGERATVTFHRYLRPQEKFESIDELKKQIDLDIREARDFFNSR